MWRSIDGKDKDQALDKEPHQNIQDKGKDESSNPINHEDCHPIWLEDGIYFFCVSLGLRILILKSIGGQIILNSCWLLKMRRPLIGGEDFEASIGQGEQAQGKVMEAYQGKGKSFGVGEKKKEEKECVKKNLKINSYVWKGVVHERDVCKN